MKSELKKISITFIVLISLISLVSARERTEDNPLENYFQEAQEAQTRGDVDTTIEACRKVLFVDQNNVRVSLLLAEALAKKGKLKKAFSEYGVALENIPRDMRVKEKEREVLTKKITEKMEALRIRIKSKSVLADAVLNFYEMNLLLLSLCVLLFFIAEIFIKGVHFFIVYKEAKEQSKIWVDRYWKKRKERDIKRFSPAFIMHVFLLCILFFGFGIVKKYGIAACASSFATAFSNIFS